MRITHLSDLHFGRDDDAVVAGLAADIGRQDPDLVVISGDFTQIGSRREFELAEAFLATLSAPVFAVPGNHDVPARNLALRFADPYRRYRRHIAPVVEPFRELDGVAIAGIKTSRRFRPGFNWADGSISREQLARLRARFAASDPAAVRIVVAHHPLLTPEASVALKAVKRADLALRTFADLGVRLVLSGHFHLSYIRRHGQTEEPETVAEAPRLSSADGIIVAQASTATSTRRRGEPNAYNLIDIRDGAIAVTVREWSGGAWRMRESVAEPGVAAAAAS